MPTIPYKNARGQRISGGTTIIGNCGWKTGPLMAWREKQDIEIAIEVFSKMLRDQIDEGKKEPPTAGTVAHYLIECHLAKKEPDLSGYPENCITLAKTAFDNFKKWAESVTLEVIELEPHLVHPSLDYGGTPDCVARVNYKPSLFDWKAGGIYEDYLLQLACYGKLWEINKPNIPLTGGFHLLEIKKENAAFTHHWWQDLPIGWEAFECCLKLHTLRKELKKML